MTSRTSQERISDALAQIPDFESISATYVSQTGTIATVNQGVNTIQVLSSSQYPLIPGDPVRLQRRNGSLVMLGPAMPRSATGMVTAIGSPRGTVEYPAGSGISAQMGYNPSYTPAVNDIVLISWDAAGGTIAFKPTAVPGPTAPPVAAPAAPQVYEQVFTAIDSGSRSSSWNQTSVWASDTYIGAWFYGSKIKDTIPDTAVINRVRIYLPITHNFGDPPQLGRHTSPTKPAGAVSISSAAALSPRSGWVDIPTALIDYLKANDGGIGLNHGGYNIYAAVASDGYSGALDIIYTA